MGTKAVVQKFDTIDKSRIRGKVKHSRTGACTCKLTERCYHGDKPIFGLRGRGKKSKSKL